MSIVPSKVGNRIHANNCFHFQIIVDTSEAGRGTLFVALRAANQSVKHNVQNLGNGLLKVIYFPKLPIPHRVDLRYSGVHASGENWFSTNTRFHAT